LSCGFVLQLLAEARFYICSIFVCSCIDPCIKHFKAVLQNVRVHITGRYNFERIGENMQPLLAHLVV